MKRAVLIIFFAACCFHLAAAQPLKPRPDAFPWHPENNGTKAISMAQSIDEMAAWDRYPTYDTYLAMMQQWTIDFPTLCHVDTIGTSIQGRLILSLYIAPETDDDLYRPEFFYSSTMHGDEVTGYVMMLHLIDTLLHGYGSNPQYTNLINRTRISINPLSNPDGTYRNGDSTVAGSMRYNAHYVDLNRNYPDPFGTDPIDPQQPENTAMINYVSSHNFRLSANLHGGSEVMNYPWDSFTSSQQPHPDRDWWIEVCRRFVDTARMFSRSCFDDVTPEGYIAGGDWYVIPNGRQDYMNYYHNCLEMTMEISTTKTLSSDRLPSYWNFLHHSLVNYIEEIHSLPDHSTEGIETPGHHAFTAHPNPTRNKLFISEETTEPIIIYSTNGRCVMQLPAGTRLVDLQGLPNGVYVMHSGSSTLKVVKQ